MKVIIMANAERALPRNYDLIVYGASGFTGRLVAEHLLGTYGRDGRNQVGDGRAKVLGSARCAARAS
jgi:hypothetical protein